MSKAIKMRISLAVAMLVLVFGVGAATAVVTADSTTWEHYYECDQVPADEGLGAKGDQADIDYTIVADGANNYMNVFSWEWYRGFQFINGNDAGSDSNDLDTKTNGGISVEYRIRVLSGDHFFHLWCSGADYNWITTYTEEAGTEYPGVMWLFNPNRTFPTQPAEMYFRDADKTKSNWRAPLGSADAWIMGNLAAGDPNFYTYRLTGNGTNWRLYRWNEDEPGTLNGMLMVDVTHSWAGPASTYQMDIYGEEGLTEFDLDYVRFTNEGAFPPFDVSCAEQGSWVGYAKLDLNEDCYVNALDFGLFADGWLTCEDTTDPLCTN